MSERLFDLRMKDGSRHFAELPETYDVATPEWERLRDAVPSLPGARLTGFVTDEVTEAWIDFELGGHAFSLNDPQGSWWLFVRDPACPDELLLRVLDHFEALLCPQASLARPAGPVARGAYRALVLEADGRATHRDFEALDEARRYADDAASETEDGVVLAYVLDDRLRTLHRGTHY